MTASEFKSQNKQSVLVNNVPIAWNEDGKGYTFFGIDAITFWLSPSLVSILTPLKDELGEELFSLIIGYEASKGTFEDYHSMVSTLGEGFQEGFLNWGRAVSAAGWGSFSVVSIDFEKKEAVVEITDPWEMKIFKAEHAQDAIPFLSGKISGIFSHAFKMNCRTDIIEAVNEPFHRRAVLRVRPSKETLEEALWAMQKDKDLPQQEQLRAVNSSLRRNQQRYSDILDTIGERIWETDPQLILRYVSDFTISNFSRSREAALGSALLDFLHEEDRATFQRLSEQVKLGHVAVAETKARYIGTNGEYRWASFRFKSVIDISGKHGGFLGSARDITAEVLLQQQLAEQQQRAHHSSKMASLGEVAAGVAHEINNPLAEIVGNIWHLQNLQKNGGLDPKTLDSALSTIDKMSKRIAEIVKGMRSFSRDAEKDLFKRATLKNILDETLVFCKRRFVNQGIDLRVHLLQEDLALGCRATQVSQVLLNLLNNAHDAILPLQEKWIELTVEKEGSDILIKITDSGPGIPKDLLGKIMQPFFTTKEPGKGTGLGLSVSRSIVESHGGQLYLDTKCANTRFVVSLPS